MEKLNELKPVMFEHLIDGHKEAIDLAQANLEKTFKFYRDIGHEGYNFERSQFIIPVREAARVADSALIDRYKASSERYPENIRKDVRLQLAIGMLKGESQLQMAKRIAPRIAKYVDPGEAVAEALQKKYLFWGERIVRSEMMEAYGKENLQNSIELHQQDDSVMTEWVAINDSRECLTCAELDGQRVIPGHSFEGGYLSPPIHPLCRCTTVLYFAR